MAGKNQHVVPRGADWAVRGAGNSRATSVHDTQAEAIANCRRTRSRLLCSCPGGRSPRTGSD